MKVIKTDIKDLLIFQPETYSDDRGYFFESYNKSKYEKFISKSKFIQDNESKSIKGVLRGFHFQKPPYEQAKLVRCVYGEVLDVAVDLRLNSKTYGFHHKVILSGQNKKQFFIPRGFAHAFLVLSDSAIFSYKVDNLYAPDYDSGIIWNDPTLAVNWDFSEKDLIISKKDKKLKNFSAFVTPFK